MEGRATGDIRIQVSRKENSSEGPKIFETVSNFYELQIAFVFHFEIFLQLFRSNLLHGTG